MKKNVIILCLLGCMFMPTVKAHDAGKGYLLLGSLFVGAVTSLVGGIVGGIAGGVKEARRKREPEKRIDYLLSEDKAEENCLVRCKRRPKTEKIFWATMKGAGTGFWVGVLGTIATAFFVGKFV